MAAIKKTNTKQVIIDSTIDLINTRDADSISLADIAHASEITKGTLFYHYTSKDLIFADIASQYLNTMMEAFVSWADNNDKDTSIKRMTNYILTYGARLNKRGKAHIYLINKALSDNVAVKELFRQAYTAWHEIILGKVKDRLASTGIDAETYTNLILIIIDGIIVQDLVGIKHIEISSIVDLLTRD